MTVSNDGATIMKALDIVHPAAKTLVDISLSQVSFGRRTSWSCRALARQPSWGPGELLTGRRVAVEPSLPGVHTF